MEELDPSNSNRSKRPSYNQCQIVISKIDSPIKNMCIADPNFVMLASEAVEIFKMLKTLTLENLC